MSLVPRGATNEIKMNFDISGEASSGGGGVRVLNFGRQWCFSRTLAKISRTTGEPGGLYKAMSITLGFKPEHKCFSSSRAEFEEGLMRKLLT